MGVFFSGGLGMVVQQQKTNSAFEKHGYFGDQQQRSILYTCTKKITNSNGTFIDI